MGKYLRDLHSPAKLAIIGPWVSLGHKIQRHDAPLLLSL